LKEAENNKKAIALNFRPFLATNFIIDKGTKNEKKVRLGKTCFLCPRTSLLMHE
jgi:hypothetical protein